MIRQSFYTFFNRFFIAMLNFVTVVITAHFLGAEGRGIISLFVLNLTITFMISSFIGGPGLVYLFPRHDATKLLSASYLWAILSCAATSFFLQTLNLVESGLLNDLIILSIIQSVMRIQTTYLLAMQKIKEYNLISVIYPVVLLVSLFYFFKIKMVQRVDEYFISFYYGLLSSLVLSTILVYRNTPLKFSFDLKNIFKLAFRLGFIIQCANILQLLNYRFSYFLLDHYYGKHEVGVYSTAISFAEAVWIIATSFATIQYSKISNSKEDTYNVNITVIVTRIVTLLTLFALLLLLLLPAAFFKWMLGNDFDELVGLFPLLAPGIFFLIFNIIISHYYSGSGNPKMGLLGSAVGFFVTIVAGYLLIPALNMKGAAITATLSYFLSSMILMVIFMKQKKISIKEFVPSFKNLLFLKEKIKPLSE